MHGHQGEMIIKRWACVGMSILIGMLLSSCVQVGVTQAITDTEAAHSLPVAEPEVVVIDLSDQGEKAALEDEDAYMLALLGEKVGSCQGLDYFLRQEKTRQEWSATFDGMIARGTQMTTEEKELIIDWLVSRQK